MSNLHEIFMLGGGLLNKRPNISNILRQQLKPIFIIPNIFVEAYAMNISAKFQLHSTYILWEVDFFNGVAIDKRLSIANMR